METSSRATSRCFMFMYFLLPHWVPATWRSRAQTSMRAELPSGKLPTTRVWRRISRLSLSMTLLVRMRIQCSLEKSQQVSVSSKSVTIMMKALYENFKISMFREKMFQHIQTILGSIAPQHRTQGLNRLPASPVISSNADVSDMRL